MLMSLGGYRWVHPRVYRLASIEMFVKCCATFCTRECRTQPEIINKSNHLCVCQFVCLFVNVWLSVCVSSACLSVYLLFVYLLSVCLSVCLSKVFYSIEQSTYRWRLNPLQHNVLISPINYTRACSFTKKKSKGQMALEKHKLTSII